MLLCIASWLSVLVSPLFLATQAGTNKYFEKEEEEHDDEEEEREDKGRRRSSGSSAVTAGDVVNSQLAGLGAMIIVYSMSIVFFHP